MQPSINSINSNDTIEVVEFVEEESLLSNAIAELNMDKLFHYAGCGSPSTPLGKQ